MTETRGPAIDRSIYPMPMFLNLHARDLGAAERLYASAGFVTLATIPGPDGSPALVHLRREKHQDILIAKGEAVPGTASASFAAGDVDLEEVARSLRAAGAEVDGPADTTWFSTDLAFTDLDGNVVTLTAPRKQDADAARAWVDDRVVGDFEASRGESAHSAVAAVTPHG